MLLPAQFEFAFQRQRCVGKTFLHVTAPDEIWFIVKTFFRQRVAKRENRRELFIFDDDFFRRRATSFRRFADDQRDDLAVKQNLLVREQNLVVFRASVIHEI